jgi:hypothetical protein
VCHTFLTRKHLSEVLPVLRCLSSAHPTYPHVPETGSLQTGYPLARKMLGHTAPLAVTACNCLQFQSFTIRSNSITQSLHCARSHSPDPITLLRRPVPILYTRSDRSKLLHFDFLRTTPRTRLSALLPSTCFSSPSALRHVRLHPSTLPLLAPTIYGSRLVYEISRDAKKMSTKCRGSV